MTTKRIELERTGQLLLEIAEEQGMYFAVAFLHDSQTDLREFLPVLEKTPGALKTKAKEPK